eukprot:g27900.t2
MSFCSKQKEDEYSVLAIAYHNVAVEHDFLQQLHEAAMAYQQGHEVAKRCLGDQHPLTQTLAKNASAALQKSEAKAEAERGERELRDPREERDEESRDQWNWTAPTKGAEVALEAVHAKNALVLDEAVRTDSTAAQPTSVNGIQRASEDPKVSAAASSGGTVVGDLEISTPAPERSRAEALVPSNLPTRLPQLPTQVILAPPPPAVALPDPGPFRAPQTLSSSCRFVVDRCQMDSHLMAAEKFDQIYARNGWGSRISELGTHTRSGLGSDLKGAFDWISGLNKFFNQNPELQIIADIPSGDIGWQMAVRHLNTAKLYFGGDIARSVAESNAKRFKDHANKVLQHWDLHSCGAPQWYTSCDSTRHPFDVIMIRDALQHIPILKVQQILHKVLQVFFHHFSRRRAVCQYHRPFPADQKRLGRLPPIFKHRCLIQTFVF